MSFTARNLGSPQTWLDNLLANRRRGLAQSGERRAASLAPGLILGAKLAWPSHAGEPRILAFGLRAQLRSSESLSNSLLARRPVELALRWRELHSSKSQKFECECEIPARRPELSGRSKVTRTKAKPIRRKRNPQLGLNRWPPASVKMERFRAAEWARLGRVGAQLSLEPVGKSRDSSRRRTKPTLGRNSSPAPTGGGAHLLPLALVGLLQVAAIMGECPQSGRMSATCCAIQLISHRAEASRVESSGGARKWPPEGG